jgi:predicted RNA-binding protein with PIN domain
MSGGQKILIDGYNVIHADRHLKSLLDPDSEQARTALIERLIHYVHNKQLQITVVFDGRGTMLDTQSIVPGKLQAMFSRDYQNADELILTILEEASNAREYLVVTSDNEDIGRAARLLGSQVLDSPSFLSRLDGPNQDATPADEKPDPTDDDIEYWLKKFNSEE